MAAGSRRKGQALRAEKARLTRRRIVAAAGELFVRDGYLETTMADIARHAGVAVQTLYLSFGSKAALLSATMDVAITGDDEPVPVIERPWFDRMRAEPDGPAALEIFVAAATEIIDRTYPLYAAVRAASADPEPAELLARNKHGRFVVHSTAVRELMGRPGFDPGLSERQAAEVVYGLLSQETYGLLVHERGWVVPAWSDWVLRHIRADLFP